MKIIPQMAISNTTNFSRASTKTYFDKNGAMQIAGINVPVWTYEPIDLTLPPIASIEPARTNVMRNTDTSANAAVVSTGTITLPDGNMSRKVIVNAGAVSFPSQGSVLQIFGLSTSTGETTDYAFSGYFLNYGALNYKPYIVIQANQSSGNYLYALATFNALTGTFESKGFSAGWSEISAPTATLMPCGMWKVEWSLRFTQQSLNRNQVGCYLQITNQLNQTIYTADGVSGFEFAFLQFEDGGSVTSYIPTTTTAASRQADLAPMMTSNVLENDYPAWSAATTYALDDRVIVVTPSSHKVYNSVQAGNINHIPVGGVADLWWELVGETNRWKAFDGYVSSQTVADVGVDFIGNAIQTTGFLDSVSLNNIDAEEVRIMQVDSAEGTVYDQTYSLISESGITDYWEYFFSPIERLSNFAVTDLPLYENTQVYVTLSDVGGNAKIGALVLGLGVDFGYAQYGLSLGMRDYSVNTEDDFGNVTILKRGYRDMMNLTVMVENPSLGAFKKFLAGLRATPAIFIGVDEYGEATNVFGYYEDWGLVISYPEHSLLTISTKGLLNGSF